MDKGNLKAAKSIRKIHDFPQINNQSIIKLFNEIRKATENFSYIFFIVEDFLTRDSHLHDRN